MKRIKVTLPDCDEPMVILLFSKGYIKTGLEPVNGRKNKKEPSWAAFLCTNPKLYSSSIIVLNYLNVAENYSIMGGLFESLVDDAAVKSYSARLWEFFCGLFHVSSSKIFDIFDIQGDFQAYFDTLEQTLSGFTPFQGCEA